MEARGGLGGVYAAEVTLFEFGVFHCLDLKDYLAHSVRLAGSRAHRNVAFEFNGESHSAPSIAGFVPGQRLEMREKAAETGAARHPLGPPASRA